METNERNMDGVTYISPRSKGRWDFTIIAMLLIGLIIGSGTVGYFHWAWKVNKQHVYEVEQ